MTCAGAACGCGNPGGAAWGACATCGGCIACAEMVVWPLVLEVLRMCMVMYRLVKVVVEVVQEGWVVMMVAMHRGRPHRGEVVVVVMMMVRGPKGHEGHRREAHRWGHPEHVCPRRLLYPARYRSC